MIYFKRVSLLILLIFVAKIQFSQCTTCNTTVTNNAVSQYNVNAGTTLCVSTGLTYTGTINLNGGTLCNSGVLSKVNFNSGTFQNYGTYSKNGNLTIQNTGNIIVNNYSGSEFRVIGNLDIQSSTINTTTSFNLISGKTSFDVTGNFNSSKGILSINPTTTANQFSEGVFFNIGKDFYIGGNATLIMNIGKGSYFNVGKVASFDGKYNKTINNYGGVINVNSSFNIGGNGQNTGVFSLLNTNNGNLSIRRAFNASYNNGTVNIINDATIEIGANWTQSKDVTNITNNGSLSITKDLNVERGTITNNGKLYARDGDVKFGVLTNNNYVNFLRDLISSNNAAIINNSGYILINREFNNIATVNLLEKSTLEAASYNNANNGMINGPLNPPDTLSYARIIISDYSENKGYINNKLVFYDQTLQFTNNNKGYGFDVVANTNRISNGVVFALKIPIVIGPPITNCSILNFLYGLDATVSSTSLCPSEGVIWFTSQFYQKVYLFGNLIKINLTLPPNSYVWSPASSFPGPPPNGQNNQNPTIPAPLATSSYTIKVNYGGCVFAKTFNVFVCGNYAVLKKELDASYYTCANGRLYFTVDGDYSNTSLNYKVYDYTRNIVPGLSINTSVLENGDNRFNLNIASLANGYYVLEVINQKQEKLVLRFKK